MTVETLFAELENAFRGRDGDVRRVVAAASARMWRYDGRLETGKMLGEPAATVFNDLVVRGGDFRQALAGGEGNGVRLHRVIRQFAEVAGRLQDSGDARAMLQGYDLIALAYVLETATTKYEHAAADPLKTPAWWCVVQRIDAADFIDGLSQSSKGCEAGGEFAKEELRLMIEMTDSTERIIISDETVPGDDAHLSTFITAGRLTTQRWFDRVPRCL